MLDLRRRRVPAHAPLDITAHPRSPRLSSLVLLVIRAQALEISIQSPAPLDSSMMSTGRSRAMHARWATFALASLGCSLCCAQQEMCVMRLAAQTPPTNARQVITATLAPRPCSRHCPPPSSHILVSTAPTAWQERSMGLFGMATSHPRRHAWVAHIVSKQQEAHLALGLARWDTTAQMERQNHFRPFLEPMLLPLGTPSP
mmetsp:Transcript_8309/g.14006  ORF Transcript_8309/g.14006 Transcript_8309/m.14006 type:complete len:201 (+) Transcript_8309:197-799(+)